MKSLVQTYNGHQNCKQGEMKEHENTFDSEGQCTCEQNARRAQATLQLGVKVCIPHDFWVQTKRKMRFL